MPFMCMPFMACNRQVDSIDRRQCNLQTVPHEVERYARHLEELLLDMNHIKELPKVLFRLTKLKTLGLSDNDIYTLPADIAQLHSLMDLNLSRNDISDLPEEINACRQLMILDLSSNPITRLPAPITELTSLTHLGLNDITLTQLPTDIGQLCNLRSLEVRENLIRSIPQSVVQLRHLQRFDLGQNELTSLPPEIGGLVSLQELYIDSNELTGLPEELLCCKNLEQLDISENKLVSLPDSFGELNKLTDLSLSQNSLQFLPNSFGKLKKLVTLKIDRNSLTLLTPAIGSCTELIELFLTENLLSELPSSIGHLTKLKTLNVDKNQLKSLPSTIGACNSLTVFSMRENLLEELPLEVGRLENLIVLDVSNNRLSFLPYTVNVLSKLQALWLSENQSQALMKLQTDIDPKTNMKVLTCYLLPQQSAPQSDANRLLGSKSFLGGPKVHFGDDELPDEDHVGDIGKFERHNTPHPKPHNGNSKVKKMANDDSHSQNEEVKINNISNNGIGSKVQDSNSLPRSALKHSSTSSCNETQSSTSLISTSQGDRICSRFGVSENQFDDSTQLEGKECPTNDGGSRLKKSNSHVSFGYGTIDNEFVPHKLKRTKTPYYGKNSKHNLVGRSLDNLHSCKSLKSPYSDIPTSSKSSDHIVSFNDETIDNEDSLRKLKRTKTPHYSKTYKANISTTKTLDGDTIEMGKQKSISELSVCSQQSRVVSFNEDTINNEFTIHKLKRTQTPHYSKNYKPHLSSQSFDDDNRDEEDVGVTFSVPRLSKSSIEVSFSKSAVDNENNECSKIKRTKTPYYSKDFKPIISSISSNNEVGKIKSRNVTFRSSISSESSHGVVFDDSTIDNENLPHKLKRTKTPHYKKDHRPSLITHTIDDVNISNQSGDDVISTNSSEHVVSFNEDTIDNENVEHKLKRTKTPHYSKTFKPSLVKKISNNDDCEIDTLSNKSTSQNSEFSQSSGHVVLFDESVIDNEDSPVKLKRTKTPHYSKVERPFVARKDSHASSTSDYGTHIKFADDAIDNSEVKPKLKRTKTPHYKKDHRPSLSSAGSSYIFSNEDEDEENFNNFENIEKASCSVSFADQIPEETLSCKLKRINTPHYKKGVRFNTSKTSLLTDETDNFDCPSDLSSNEDNKLCNTLFDSNNEERIETVEELDNDNNFKSTPLSEDINTSLLNTTERSFVLKLSKKKGVKFEDSCNNDNESSDNCKLNRQNTPHNDLTIQQQQNNNLMETKRIRVKRDDKKSIGLTIAGGIECTPYKENDSGIFISKLAQDGPAMIAGLKVGDKIIRVNDIDVQNIRHEQFIECMKCAGDVFILTIQRDNNTNFIPTPISSPLPEPPYSLNSSFIDIVRDFSGSPGFSIVGGQGKTNEEIIIVSAVTLGGPADKVGLKTGDIILNINGTSVKGIRHDQAVTLLTGSPNQEVKIKILRDTCVIPPIITPVTSPIPQPMCNSFSSMSNISMIPSKTIIFGEPSWDGKIENVELQRDLNKSLGLSIVGGSDQCSHPFGIEKRGVFISKITPNSPAAYCGRLRIGDRILSVNDKDIRNSKHKEAVDILKGSGPILKIGVLHEPQPTGLKEVSIRRRVPNESLGLVICGGTRSPQANPNDKTDEGIFVERVDPNSCAAECPSIQNGVRILEVNDDSILGCTQDEAASLLRNSGIHIRLLICDGFNKSSSITQISPIFNTIETSSVINAPGSVPDFGTEEILASSPNLNITLPATSSPLSVDNNSALNTSNEITSTTPQPPAYDSHNFKSNIAFEDAVPLITSTPLPPADENSKIPKLKIPPPVAPKPTLSTSSQSKLQNTSSNNDKSNVTQDAELLPFSSKLKKFESEISFASKGIPTKNYKNSKSTTSIPAKKPLITEDEMKKMKEEEGKKMNYLTNQNDIPSPAIEGNFDQMISKIPISINGPNVVRTKKAEMRLANVTGNQSNNDVSPLTAIEQHALELKKRQEWRQARLKSIDNDMAKTEEVLNSFQRINSRVGNISEDGSIPSTPIPRPLNDSSNKTEP
uniref:PDZ domain-containing protein n=1 Tax=Strongyloides stercoralis TaxID=6248 RepID=A0A0K0DWJ0_STRER